jgi:hypothetical protein
VSEHEQPDAEPDDAPDDEGETPPLTGPDEWDDPVVGLLLDDDGSGVVE